MLQFSTPKSTSFSPFSPPGYNAASSYLPVSGGVSTPATGSGLNDGYRRISSDTVTGSANSTVPTAFGMHPLSPERRRTLDTRLSPEQAPGIQGSANQPLAPSSESVSLENPNENHSNSLNKYQQIDTNAINTTNFTVDSDGWYHYNHPQSQESTPNEANQHETRPQDNDSQNPVQYRINTPLTSHQNRREWRRQDRVLRKNTKAAITIASLNMRGIGSPGANKWFHINQIMRNKRIGMLLVQETHLTREKADELEKLHKQLVIYCSTHPDKPTGVAGVAIVLHKWYTSTDKNNIQVIEIIPGRALQITTKWHQQDKMTALVVYAPNVTEREGEASKSFWKDIQKYYETHPCTRKPDIVAGDFNIVEAGAMDRIPARADPDNALNALDNLKLMLNLKDGWRDTYPSMKQYTFFQRATGSQS
ncbi:hypothetical protein D9758_003023 [Tetrapyrgos nigripes]|uniref:DNase I-like protein n=1 Tax=Tetrapyrgos nigripes TaxID=182062 RepID=A0A8H5GPK8_9AGAR|nr:hypothetical protein D9758_003023 [Tetrapyrgos nigripes]